MLNFREKLWSLIGLTLFGFAMVICIACLVGTRTAPHRLSDHEDTVARINELALAVNDLKQLVNDHYDSLQRDHTALANGVVMTGQLKVNENTKLDMILNAVTNRIEVPLKIDKFHIKDFDWKLVNPDDIMLTPEPRIMLTEGTHVRDTGIATTNLVKSLVQPEKTDT